MGWKNGAIFHGSFPASFPLRAVAQASVPEHPHGNFKGGEGELQLPSVKAKLSGAPFPSHPGSGGEEGVPGVTRQGVVVIYSGLHAGPLLAAALRNDRSNNGSPRYALYKESGMASVPLR